MVAKKDANVDAQVEAKVGVKVRAKMGVNLLSHVGFCVVVTHAASWELFGHYHP